MSPCTLGIVVDGRWRPGIGDPTVAGWVTVAAYLGCAWLAWRLARGRRRGGEPTSARAWMLMTLLLIVLGVNKQLDLQSWFSQEARQLVRAWGWYENRRMLQASFIVVVTCLGMAGLAAMGWSIRSTLRSDLPALMGIATLLVFVLVRAASFHHVDQMLGMNLIGMRFNVFMELGGLGLTALGLVHGRAHPENGSART